MSTKKGLTITKLEEKKKLRKNTMFGFKIDLIPFFFGVKNSFLLSFFLLFFQYSPMVNSSLFIVSTALAKNVYFWFSI